MPYLNFVSTEAGADAYAARTGYFEYGSDKTNSVGSFPFRVDQAGNITTSGTVNVPGVTAWINVKAAPYNAAGNGTTDDTAAIQAAISAANTAGGGLVYFPDGTYVISSKLSLFSNVTLQGTGRFTTIIKQTSTTANCLDWSGNQLQYVTIRSMTLLGPGSGTGAGLSIVASGGSNPNAAVCHFEDLLVKSFGSHGITTSILIASQFDNCEALSNGGDGFQLLASGTSVSMNACFANGNTGNGYNINGLAYGALNACAADNNAVGYLVTSCHGVAFNGCGQESGPVGFKIAGGTGVTLTACQTFANSNISFWATSGAQNVTFVNCIETSPSSATHSFQFDTGCSVNVIGWSFTTSVLETAPANHLNDGSGNAQLAGGLIFMGAVGSNTAAPAGGANIAVPMTISTGVAMQPNTGTDMMVYLAVTTSSVVAIQIGATSTPNVTIFPSATAAIGMISFRVPKGWWLKSTFTAVDVTWTAIPC